MAGLFGHMTADAIAETREYVSPVPVWQSGREAFQEGMAGVADPSPEAEKLIVKLTRRKKGLDAKTLEERTGRQIEDVETAIEAMNEDLELIREYLTEPTTEEG